MLDTNQLTLEQQRAKDAWDCSKGCDSAYVNLAKSLPALIMNSGLLQVMAFLHEKSSKQGPHRQLGEQMRKWLSNRYPHIVASADFKEFMLAVMAADPQSFRLINQEAFDWLRWIRQMAPAAVVVGSKG